MWESRCVQGWPSAARQCGQRCEERVSIKGVLHQVVVECQECNGGQRNYTVLLLKLHTAFARDSLNSRMWGSHCVQSCTVVMPGHTPDHCSVWILKISTLLAGDAAEFPFPSVRGGATLGQVRASLHYLKTFNPSVVLPCHGGTTGPDLLDQNLAYFSRLRDLVKAEAPLGHGSALTEAALPSPLKYEAILEGLGTIPERVPAFYRGFHLDAVRATVEETESEDHTS